MGFKTVYDGEKAIIVNRNGEKKIVDGPQRLFLFLAKLEKLNAYVADSSQYLVVKYIDGRVIHKPGPVKEWYNRFEHESPIEVRDAYKLSDSQVLIVYSYADDDVLDNDKDVKKKNHGDTGQQQVKFRLVNGPCVFVPNAKEWLHEFSWHAPDPDKLGHMIPNGSKFQVLNLNAADYFHYHVNEVRTLDDTLITIKLTVIYQLEDILKMLKKTQDPISDFLNAICADVISFVSKLTLAEFLAVCGEKLNDLATYSQLMQRAQNNGYRIQSIIYNGYLSSSALQTIQDDAIQARTQLRLNAETDEQKNKIIGVRLNAQEQRLQLEQQLAKLKCEFEQRVLDASATFELDTKQLEHEHELKVREAETNTSMAMRIKEHECREEYLKRLAALAVDVNAVQLKMTRNEHGAKVDKQYQFVQE